jgi:hypothetical protein
MTTSRVVITAEAAQAVREFQRFRAEATGALQSIANVGSKLTGMLGALGAGAAVAAFAGWIKGAIDATDAASDLSQKTGIAIKDLAGLELAYQMGGMGAEALASTQTKLAKAMVDGSEGFEKIGVKSRNLDGSLKSNRQMMSEVADRFAGMEDGAEKTALAIEIFGKSGADMIPMLNGGSAGLQEMDDMAAKLGLTLSDKAVEQAGAFNDTLDLLMLGGQGVARGIAAELLPTLSSLAGSFLTSMTQGDRLKNTAQFLANVLKILYTVGVGIVEVFSTVGKTLGAAGAQLIAILNGDFKAAAQIGRDWADEIGKDWAGSAKAISDAWSTSGDATVETMAKIVRSGTVVGKSAAELKKQAAEANKERAAEAKLLAELSGVTASYMDDLSSLNAVRLKGKVTEEQYIGLVTELINKQPGVKAAIEAETKARKELADFEQDYIKAKSMVSDLLGKAVEDAEKEAEQQEVLARTYGLTAAEIGKLELARLQEQLAQRSANGLTLEEIETLERLIGAKQRAVTATTAIAEKDLAKKLVDEGTKAAESIQQSLTDALMRGFEDGKGFAENMATTIKNLFKTMVLRPVVSAIVTPIAGSVTNALGLSGATTAAGVAGGGYGNILSTAGNTYNMISGGMTLGGGLGTGFMGSLAGGLNGAGVGSGLTSSLGLNIGNGIAGVIGEGAATTLSSGLSAFAAAAPYLAVIAGAYAIYKQIDDSGTYHTGGASYADSSGSRTIRAESIGFEKTRTASDTEKMTGALAQGIVGLLDSTALTFGKTAGYSAATAFADDTSKDGAWGALVIKNLSGTVLDWNNGRTSGWAPKEFADGEKGQEQYLAALTSSVRTALDGIGLPAWAKKMMQGVASNASLEDLAKVVQQINTTQKALKIMGDSLVGFAELSDAAVSALIAAAGGIDGLASSASSYYQNFYTEAERLSQAGKGVAEALASVGLQMPASRAAYRALLEQQMALGGSGAPAVAMLLRANEAFAALYPEVEATNDALRSQADILSERQALQKELDQLTMSTAELRAQERAALDESNRALYDQVTLQRALKESTQASSAALQDTVERLTATRDSTTSYLNSLMTGSLSTLTPMQKYLETQRQYNDQVQKALANPADSAAVSGAQAAATAWLTASQIVNASSAAFVGDQSKVMSDMSQLAAIAGVQMTDAQRQLSALDKQVVGIAQLNDTAAAIEQAIRNQSSALPVVGIPAFDVQRYAAGSTAAADTLVAEIKGMRAEMDALRRLNADMLAEQKLSRTDANRNAEKIAGVTEGVGETVAKEVGEAVEQAAYRATNPTKVAPR